MDRQENDMEKMFQEKVAQRKANQEMTIREKMAEGELVEEKAIAKETNGEKSILVEGHISETGWLNTRS